MNQGVSKAETVGTDRADKTEVTVLFVLLFFV